VETKQNKMKLNKLTKHQTLSHSKRKYNYAQWEIIVNNYDKYYDVEYYECNKSENKFYEDNLFVVYTLPNGLRVLDTILYPESFINRGFIKVYINNNENVVTNYFFNLDGKEFRVQNCEFNIKYLSKLSKEEGIIFTTIL